MFINPLSGRTYSLAHVRKARQGVEKRGDKRQTALHFDDGESELVADSEFADALRNTVQQMVPAAPETYSLESYLDDDDQLGVWRTPVIAWAVSADGLVYPVTHMGVGGEDGKAGPILYPDGQVIDWDSHHRKLDDWRVYERDRLIASMAAKLDRTTYLENAKKGLPAKPGGEAQ